MPATVVEDGVDDDVEEDCGDDVIGGGAL